MGSGMDHELGHVSSEVMLHHANKNLKQHSYSKQSKDKPTQPQILFLPQNP